MSPGGQFSPSPDSGTPPPARWPRPRWSGRAATAPSTRSRSSCPRGRSARASTARSLGRLSPDVDDPRAAPLPADWATLGCPGPRVEPARLSAPAAPGRHRRAHLRAPRRGPQLQEELRQVAQCPRKAAAESRWATTIKNDPDLAPAVERGHVTGADAYQVRDEPAGGQRWRLRLPRPARRPILAGAVKRIKQGGGAGTQSPKRRTDPRGFGGGLAPRDVVAQMSSSTWRRSSADARRRGLLFRGADKSSLSDPAVLTQE